MSITQCVTCGREVRLPETVAAVWVRCPHCGDEYALDNVLDQLPPRLLVVSSPPAERDPGQPTHATDESATSTGKPQKAPPGVPLMKESVESAPRVTETPIETPFHLPSPHSERPKSRGGAKYLPIKVVLGGFTGLVLGQLLLWWLPGRLRTDPFQLATKLPPALAFLAPASLRGPADDLQPAISADGNGNAEVTLLTDGFDDEQFDSLEDNASTPPDSQVALVGLANAPRLGTDQLQASLKRSREFLDEFNAADEWTTTAVDSWYSDLCNFGRDITFADPADTNIKVFAHDARTFLLRVVEDPRRVSAIEESASRWIARSDNDRKGIVVVGKVTQVVPTGDLFQTTMKYSGTAIYVVSRIDPRNNPVAQFSAGDTVLIVGVIVVDPSLNLLGYQGDKDLVVLGGMPVKLARPNAGS